MNINTTVKITSVCDGDARSVGDGRGWLAGDTDGLADWPVTVGVVSQPGADAERCRCACLYCTQGLAGRGDGYQCGIDWWRSSYYTLQQLFVLRLVQVDRGRITQFTCCCFQILRRTQSTEKF